MVWLVPAGSESVCLCRERCLQNSFLWFVQYPKAQYWVRSLSFAKHIDCIIKSCNFYIRNIGRIRQFLFKNACEMLVVALVTSRLDYYNSLLNGLSQTHMLRLQRVQNTAARLICRIEKFDHISTSLQSLHWLPVVFRPRFKLLCLVFRALRGVGPFTFRS